MAVSPLDVLNSAGAGQSDLAIAARAVATADALVQDHIAENLLDPARPVPGVVADEAMLRVAVELFARAKTPHGQQIMADANGSPVTVRLSSDPLGGVRQLLAQWVGADLGIA